MRIYRNVVRNKINVKVNDSKSGKKKLSKPDQLLNSTNDTFVSK